MNVGDARLLGLLWCALLTSGCGSLGASGEVPEERGDAPELQQEFEVRAEVQADSPGLPETGGDEAGVVLPEIVLSPGVIDFNEVALGHQNTLSLWLMNKGDDELAVDMVRLSTDCHPDVELAAAYLADFKIEPQQQREVQISFAPKQYFATTSEAICHVEVVSNDPDESVVSVPVFGNVAVGLLETMPAGLVNFGQVGDGLTIERTLMVSNAGFAPLLVTGLELEFDPLEGLFEVTGVSDALEEEGLGELAAGESAGLTLSFTNPGGVPGTEVHGLLRINTDHPIEPAVEVALMAHLAGPAFCELVFVPATLDFGTVTHGHEKTDTLLLKNVGTGYCTFESAMIRECVSFMGMMTTCHASAGASSEFVVVQHPEPSEAQVAPGAALPIVVLYKPPTSIPWIPIFEEYYGVLQVVYSEQYSQPVQNLTRWAISFGTSRGVPAQRFWRPCRRASSRLERFPSAASQPRGV